VKGVLVAAATSLVLALLGTPWFIKWLVKKQYGQFIRDDGPTSHRTKRGTPTMGGTVIVGATLAAYFLSHLVLGTWPSVSGLLVLFLMTGLALVGFLDDFIKISRQRSLGLHSKQKLLGQGLVGVIFAVLALQFENAGTAPRPRQRSRSCVTLPFDLAFAGPAIGLVLFVLWANFIITAMSNGCQPHRRPRRPRDRCLDDDLRAYVLIGIWTSNQNCQTNAGPEVLRGPRPLDLAVVAAAAHGCLLRLPVVERLAGQDLHGRHGLPGPRRRHRRPGHHDAHRVPLGHPRGLFVLDHDLGAHPGGVFKTTRKRFFRMAPLHHHFEMLGWEQITSSSGSGSSPGCSPRSAWASSTPNGWSGT
jgi:phospho-N-acetylmuramoyl-pentapeptide-transferase